MTIDYFIWRYVPLSFHLKATKAIKGLALNLSKNNTLSISAEAFKEMKRLYLLQLNHVQLTGDYKYVSTELRWLCWHGFTLENMPMNLCLQKIVAIDLKWSNLTKVWDKSQVSTTNHLVKLYNADNNSIFCLFYSFPSICCLR